MPKKPPLKYSSEGIPFPPNMGMDEKDGYILFYDKTREFTEKNKKPRAFINLEKKTLTFYSRDDEKWKTVDYSHIVDTLNQTLFEIENNLDTRDKINKTAQSDYDTYVRPQLNGISDASIVFGVGARYTHYKLFMSQWKIDPN